MWDDVRLPARTVPLSRAAASKHARHTADHGILLCASLDKRSDPQSSLSVLLPTIGLPNGMTWDTARQRMYFNETLASNVFIYATDDVGVPLRCGGLPPGLPVLAPGWGMLSFRGKKQDNRRVLADAVRKHLAGRS